MWSLIIFSDQVNIDHPWFQHKPQTNAQYLVFILHWGYFCGVNAIVGHELLHRKENHNKVIGTWPYTKFLYSHFLDEHVNGHHRYIATLEDPATGRKNEPVQAFIFRSIYGSHVNTWNRYVGRIKRRLGEKATIFDYVARNRMTHWFLLHVGICSVIYKFLGW